MELLCVAHLDEVGFEAHGQNALTREVVQDARDRDVGAACELPLCLFGIRRLGLQVKLHRQGLLEVAHQPLKVEATRLDLLAHSLEDGKVRRGVLAEAGVEHLDSDVFPLLRPGFVHLRERGRSDRLRVDRAEQLTPLLAQILHQDLFHLGERPKGRLVREHRQRLHVLLRHPPVARPALKRCDELGGLIVDAPQLSRQRQRLGGRTRVHFLQDRFTLLRVRNVRQRLFVVCLHLVEDAQGAHGPSHPHPEARRRIPHRRLRCGAVPVRGGWTRASKRRKKVSERGPAGRCRLYGRLSLLRRRCGRCDGGCWRCDRGFWRCDRGCWR
mmetsp:Transcript_16845/g.37590  ORF Transcript_16845/g.37590 Transcript_16845/m.37590 type:complete len:327 (+) Transcript_16845:1031-2011(+)